MKKFYVLVLLLIISCSQNVYSQNSQTTQLNSNQSLLNDDSLHIYFCGTGVPNPIRQSVRKASCLAVMVNNDFMLFDAGEAAIITLAALKLPISSISKIFFTHWHSDHFSGLGQVMNVSWYAGRSKPLDIYGPYGVKDVVNGIIKAYRQDVLFRSINQKFDPNAAFATTHVVNPHSKELMVYNNNGVTVSAFEVDHAPVYPALGYTIHYKGCKIVISGDTRIVASLADNSKNADVLINEALNTTMYTESKKPATNDSKSQLAAIESYHSDTIELAKMAHNSNVKNLFLTHLLPSISTKDEDKKQFISGMSQYYSKPITVTDDGDELVVSSDGSNCMLEFRPINHH
ncbi:MBL fold metallo-hydrolase [Legionella quateirensis]|uniref:Metallo-beta-lactamase n=1 Tax=Legionella quateirensis TaxID=45072 RepID=A0A378KTI2_9GAMM|nr:MBL fold metallo-hydrolase [Legionella quateirensis]KTD51275.1 metallo-beta-lactamase [Legionella quateirensis]STY17479.1 metallo-beta-lactamase [Legionella quateirensis]